MQRAGHIGAALAAYAPVGFVTTALGRPDLAFLGALASVGLAMLPDVDLRLPLVAHRGPTHTVWFALCIAIGGGYVGWSVGVADGPFVGVRLGTFGALVAGLAVGSHVAADALTPMGVRPLAPLVDRRVSLDLTRASNPITNRLVLLLGVGLTVGAFGLGRWLAGI